LDFKKTNIEGVWITHSPMFADERGYFRECAKFTESARITGEVFSVAQTNTSMSKLGVVRGMHFSTNPTGQWKWITCLSGSILDVVVDIRVNSSTFLEKIQLELSDSNQLGLLIQGNLAHGFQSLKKDSIVAYNLSSEYCPELEFEISPLDSDLAIEWPINEKIISRKDQAAPSLRDFQTAGDLPR
jgi:dTDP-4-dehydrorhamnose 3,5-epimerase